MIPVSFSRIKVFKQCAKRFRHQFVLKDLPKVPDSTEQKQGKLQHEMLQKRVSEETPFPAGYEQLEGIARVIIAAPGQSLCELQLALDWNRRPCGFKDWKNCWMRTIIDIMKVNCECAWFGDYKTGKPDNDKLQHKINAAIGFQHYPGINTITTSYLWLKTGELDTEVYTRADLSRLWSEISAETQRIQLAEESNVWPARPSGLCPWCPVNYAGKCEYARGRPR